MGSGSASWAVATWHVLVDGVNALTCGTIGFPAGFQFFWAIHFLNFAEIFLLFLRN